MSRDAVVIGINEYNNLSPLNKPANDAEAIGELLKTQGDFKVTYLPGKLCIDNSGVVEFEELKKEIITLFNRETEIALLFFAGHVLDDNEGFIAASNTNPNKLDTAISFKWLADVLQNSKVHQQIVFIDACFSGKFIDYVKNFNSSHDRCLVTSARADEEALDQGLLTQALLDCLDYTKQAKDTPWVTNDKLTELLEDYNKTAEGWQRFKILNTGQPIVLTNEAFEDKDYTDVCPYKGLNYFDNKFEDAFYFKGRSKLTNELLEKIKQTNFLAVLGASGNGKSSVVRAGLLYQLQQNKRWKILPVITPTAEPLKALSNVIDIPAEQLSDYINQAETERIVLVIDQFEEIFTLCKNDEQRNKYFAIFLDAVKHADNKFCLVVVMRADFLDKCSNYADLAKKIQDHQIIVTPMTKEELEEAIVEPIKLVGLQIEPKLVSEMLVDVKGESGSLPLLQYALTELYKKCAADRLLSLSAYTELGQIKGTLEKRANAIYKELSEEEQKVSKLIFLELIELTELKYTKRQVSIKQLENLQALKPELLNQVIQKLVKANLVVTDKSKEQQVSVVNIAHEALIQHWEQLHHWAESYSDALIGIRNIEAAAKEWETNKKDKDYLLIGPKLATAEDYLNNYADKVSVSNLAQEFVQKSINNRWIKHYRFIAILTLVILVLAWFGFDANQQQKIAEEQRIEADQQRDAAKVAQSKAEQSEQAIKKQAQITLREKLGAQSVVATHLPNAANGYYEHALLLAVQAFKEKDTGRTRSNLLRVLQAKDKPYLYLYGHLNNVVSLAFSPDDKILASAAYKKKIFLWDVETGKLLGVLFDDSNSSYDSLVFSPDGQILASGNNGNIITFWDVETRKILGKALSADNGLTNLAFSPDGNILASSSSNLSNSKIQLWNVKTRTLQGELLGHSPSKQLMLNYIDMSFSPDGKTIATAGSEDKVIWLWNVETKKQVAKLLYEDHDGFYSITFSPDGNFLASRNHKNIILWDVKSRKILGKTSLYGQYVNLIVNYSNSLSFSADGNNLVFFDINSVRWWHVDRMEQLSKSLLLDHNDNLRAMAFSPYGNIFAYSVSNNRKKDNSVKLFRSTRKNLKNHDVFFLDKKFTKKVVFSIDGKTLASTNDKSITLWDLKNKTTIAKLLNEDDGSIECVTFSPNGKTIVYGTSTGNIHLWEVDTKKPTGKLLTHNSGYAVNSVIFSPDGKTIASGSMDTTVILWDIETRKQLGKPLSDLSGPVYSLSYSPDGNILASGNGYGTVILWDIKKRKHIGELLTGKNFVAVKSVDFSPDGKTIAAGNDQGLVKLWDFDTRKQLGESLAGHHNSIININFSPNGNTLALGSDYEIILWNIDTRNTKNYISFYKNFYFKNKNYSFAFSPDGKTIASGGEYGVRLFSDLKNRKKTSKKGLLFLNFNIYIDYFYDKSSDMDDITNINLSPDGNTIAFVKKDGNRVTLLDLKTKELIRKSLPDDSSVISNVAFSPNGNLFALSHQKYKIHTDFGYMIFNYNCKLWNMDTREIILEYSDCPYGYMAFSSDGKILITRNPVNGIDDLQLSKLETKIIKEKIIKEIVNGIDSLQLWNIETKKIIKEINNIKDFTLSPDGKMIALWSDSDKGVKLWNMDTMKYISQPLASSQEIVLLAFSPDGNILAFVNKDNNIILWDVKTGKPIGKPLFGHNHKIESIIFSPDGKTLASLDGSNLRLWDVETRRQVGEPFVVNSGFNNHSVINFSLDSNKLIVIGFNGSVKLLDVNPKSWAKKACAIVNRNFTQEEWQKYMGNRPHEKTCPNLLKDTVGAIELIRQAKGLINQYDFQNAETKIQNANALDPNLKTISKIEQLNGFIKNKWYLDRILRKPELQIISDDKYSSSMSYWNNLCWFGSLYGYINEVKEVCETAVTLEPKNIWNRRSRGIYKALIGDIQGAILDFQFFVDAIQNNNIKLQQQLNTKPKKDNPFTMQLQEQRWLEILQQGKNPFTSEEIEKLKKLKFGEFKPD